MVGIDTELETTRALREAMGDTPVGADSTVSSAFEVSLGCVLGVALPMGCRVCGSPWGSRTSRPAAPASRSLAQSCHLNRSDAPRCMPRGVPRASPGERACLDRERRKILGMPHRERSCERKSASGGPAWRSAAAAAACSRRLARSGVVDSPLQRLRVACVSVCVGGCPHHTRQHRGAPRLFPRGMPCRAQFGTRGQHVPLL